jgi:hypothetical protein
MEIESGAYPKIMEDRRMKVGWNRCYVVDAIDIKRCFNCSSFGHIAKDCRASGPVCPRCAGCHKINECSSNRVKCNNCLQLNEKFNANVNVNHCTWDKNCCTFKKKIEMKKKSIKFD